tara:strand:- start:2571 stop:3182 length:612 start_codon:yes stop_codon:yes gene_type:complete
MDFSKFLFIDFSVVIIISIFVYFFNKENNSISNNSQKESPLNSSFLPNKDNLIELEKRSRKDGSGINFNDLIGIWNFFLVWKPASDNADSISSSLLRLFSAKLELNKTKSRDVESFYIVNSITFAKLSLQFKGIGSLEGNQPLLPFFFEKIQLNLGSAVLISRELDIPAKSNRPFFSLIALDKKHNWLAARGRGGGLAVWVRG